MKRNPRIVLRVVATGLASAALSCLHPAEERAHRDETIGKGTLGSTVIEVEGGLAAIRRFEPGFLTLWGKAPSMQIKITRAGGGTESFVFTVSNALPDAVLEVKRDSGDFMAPDPLPTALPTEKQWTISLPSGTTTLLVHPLGGEPTARWRFALLSDIQEAIDRVQDIYTRMNDDPTISFVVCAGDLTPRGSDEQLDRFQHELESLHIPFYPTLGNHELGTDDGAPYQRHFGRANFRFVHGGMQFTFLDSASATLDPLVYDWLDTWLAEGQRRTHAVLMHIPPVDPFGVRNGSFASRDEASMLLSKLARGGVDLTLYGHIHSYYAFSNANIPAYISGGGGAIPERFDGIGRHYLTVDVDPIQGILQTGVVRIDLD